MITSLLAKLAIGRDRVIWFEHGPSDFGSSLACGVDHAHLHLIVDAPFSFQEFVSAAIESSGLQWVQLDASLAHERVTSRESYLLAASGDRALVAKNVECVGSQFFRRIVADLVQRPDDWNYQSHPHFHNIWKTVRAFDQRSTCVSSG
jgi:ATP adenylyltransferase